MPTLDWLHREAAFQTAARVPTRVLRPHAAGHVFGDPAHAGNLLNQFFGQVCQRSGANLLQR